VKKLNTSQEVVCVRACVRACGMDTGHRALKRQKLDVNAYGKYEVGAMVG
jgi:hypothetical protein